MSRNTRQSKILSIIALNDIETQEELVLHLKKEGFCVTQATISRDIKELNLVKLPTVNNKYKYVARNSVDDNSITKSIKLLKDTVVSVVVANNIIVAKTIANSATVASTIINQLSLSGVLGVIGNGDCVLIVTLDNETAQNVATSLNKLII